MTELDLTLEDLRDAEKVPTHSNDNSFMVRLGENDYRTIPNTGFTTLALHGDNHLLDTGTKTVGDIRVTVDFDEDEFVMERDSDSVRLPEEHREAFLYAVYDEDEARLTGLFDELWTPTVREGAMDWFLPRFRSDDEIAKTDDGWLVDDDVLVRWDGSNEVADESIESLTPYGNDAGVGRTALDIDFPSAGAVTATTPAGRTYELDRVEAEFLATVAIALQTNPDMYDDGLHEYIDASEEQAFTDPKSGIYHGHSLAKHRVQHIGVTDEAAEMLWSNEYDHSACHELMLRRGEFEDAPIDVFENAPNDDQRKWSQVKSAKESAPIPEDFKQRLHEMFDSDD